jgi:hypothetical protein
MNLTLSRSAFALLSSLTLVASASAFAASGNSVSQSYKEVQTFMQDLVKKHPTTTQIFDLGMSDAGVMIQGLKIGNGAVHNLVVATHHGNEYGSTEVAKAFAESVSVNPIQGQTLFVIPVLNVSGFNAHRREELGSDKRLHDPNRDYPGPCGTEGPFSLKSTAALAKLLADQNVVTSATLHTYQPAVVYPWGISSHDLSTPYDDIFKQIVESAVTESHYDTGNNTELIYPADGAYEDYAYWKHGVWSILFELGYSHEPSNSDVEELKRVNVPGLRNMMLQAPTVRAEKHDFTGHCDYRMMSLDKHDE